MKFPLLYTIIAGTVTPALQGVVISFSDANLAAATTDVGSAAVDGASTAENTIFTVTGVDVDGDSTNDTFNITIGISSTSDGTTAQTVSFNAGNNRYDAGGSTDLEVGETMTFSFLGVNGTASNGEAITVNSFNFTRIDGVQFQNGDAWQANVGSGAINADNNIDDLTGSTFTITSLDDPNPPAGETSNGFRVRDFYFEIDVIAVPEPGSSTLLMGGLALLAFSRRRKQ